VFHRRMKGFRIMVIVSVLLFDVMEHTNSDKYLNLSNINMHNNIGILQKCSRSVRLRR
jgi:hypothetical protein